MAITRITSQDSSNTSTTTSVTATYAANPKPGHLLVACIGHKDTAGATVTGWTLANSTTPGLSSIIEVYYRVADGTETGVTATNLVGVFMGIAAYEYANTLEVSPFETISGSGASDAGAVLTLTNATPGQQTSKTFEVMIAAATFSANNTFSSWTNSFNSITNTGTGAVGSLFTADFITKDRGKYVTTITTTGTPTSASLIVVGFKASNKAFSYNPHLRPHPFSPGLAR